MESIDHGSHLRGTELSDSTILIGDFEEIDASELDDIERNKDKVNLYDHSHCVHGLDGQKKTVFIFDLGKEVDIEKVQDDDAIDLGGEEVVEEEVNGDDDGEEEEEEEEEFIDLRPPQCLEKSFTGVNHEGDEEEGEDDEDDEEDDDEDDEEESSSAVDSSECESNPTMISFLDHSPAPSDHQQAKQSHKEMFGGYSDLEDNKIEDLSRSQDLPLDKDHASGAVDNKGFDTVDSIDEQVEIVHVHLHQNLTHLLNHRQLNGSNEETVGLLSEEALTANEDNVDTGEDQVKADDDEQTEIMSKPLSVPITGSLSGEKDDQCSLIPKHSSSIFLQNATNKLNEEPSACSASASSVSCSSTTSKTIARRMVKSSGKAVKSISKRLSKMFK